MGFSFFLLFPSCLLPSGLLPWNQFILCCVLLLQDCYRVYQAIDRMPYLVEALEGYTGQHSSLIMEVFSNPIKVSPILSVSCDYAVAVAGSI